jgi:hypothetical protein
MVTGPSENAAMRANFICPVAAVYRLVAGHRAARNEMPLGAGRL